MGSEALVLIYINCILNLFVPSLWILTLQNDDEYNLNDSVDYDDYDDDNDDDDYDDDDDTNVAKTAKTKGNKGL